MGSRAFLQSAGGRIALLTGGLALATPGVLALLGPGEAATLITAVSILLCVVGCLFAVVLSLQAFFSQTLTMVIALPLAAGVYLALLSVAPVGGALLVAASFTAAAVVLAALTSRGGRREPAPARATA